MLADPTSVTTKSIIWDHYKTKNVDGDEPLNIIKLFEKMTWQFLVQYYPYTEFWSVFLYLGTNKENNL